MSKIKEVIKARVESLMTDATSLSEEIDTKSEKFQELSIKVREQKKKMSELKLKEEDFYEDLAELSRLNYSLFLMGENYKHVVSGLYEIDIQKGLLGFSYEDLGIDKDVEEDIKTKVKSASPLYTTKSGKITVADKDLHKMVFEGMEQKLADKKVLSQSFKMMQ